MLQQLTGQGCTPSGGRFLLHVCEAFADLADLQTASANFALFTAFDLVSEKTEDMRRVAQGLVARGLAYACCWGADCERWHDAIDAADIERKTLQSGDYRDVVMTTWHSKETLEQAMWFFEFAAEPAEAYSLTCVDYVFAVLPQYEAAVRQSLADAKFAP